MTIVYSEDRGRQAFGGCKLELQKAVEREKTVNCFWDETEEKEEQEKEISIPNNLICFAYKLTFDRMQ